VITFVFLFMVMLRTVYKIKGAIKLVQRFVYHRDRVARLSQ